MEVSKSAESILSALEKGALEWALTLSYDFLENSISKEGPIVAEDFPMIEALYFLALKIIQRGGNADKILQSLGIRWTLSAELLSLPRPQQSHSVVDELSPVKLIANAIPEQFAEEMLLRLQEGFARHAPFWHQHEYGLETPFHSYLLTELDREAVTLLNQTAQCVLKHVRAEYPDTAQDITAAEFWAHLRGADSGHQLHVDTDESLLQAGEKSNLPHPVVSAVVFLECCACAGPTLVLSHGKPSRQGHKAWPAYPLEGALLLYPGSLFHGVLPGLALPDLKAKSLLSEQHNLVKGAIVTLSNLSRTNICSKHKDRTTLIFAFWSGPKKSRTAPGLGPCMPYHASRPQPAAEERQSVLQAPAVACEWSSGCRQHIQEAIAWQKVPRNVGIDCKYTSAPLPDLRFFLRRRNSLQQLYS